jgi:hypothetical protein
VIGRCRCEQRQPEKQRGKQCVGSNRRRATDRNRKRRFMPGRNRQSMTPPATMAPIWPVAEGIAKVSGR